MHCLNGSYRSHMTWQAAVIPGGLIQEAHHHLPLLHIISCTSWCEYWRWQGLQGHRKQGGKEDSPCMSEELS